MRFCLFFFGFMLLMLVKQKLDKNKETKLCQMSDAVSYSMQQNTDSVKKRQLGGGGMVERGLNLCKNKQFQARTRLVVEILP